MAQLTYVAECLGDGLRMRGKRMARRVQEGSRQEEAVYIRRVAEELSMDS